MHARQHALLLYGHCHLCSQGQLVSSLILFYTNGLAAATVLCHDPSVVSLEQLGMQTEVDCQPAAMGACFKMTSSYTDGHM